MRKKRNDRKDRKPRENTLETNGKLRPKVTVEPLNDKQKDYYISLLSSPCVVCIGSAGTGKTFLAASVAAKDLSERRIKRIILSRANVSTGKSLGAFPGTVEEKMLPWLLPITDVLRKQLGNGFFEHAFGKTIEIQPLETIRGRSFDDSIVLMDEAQQLTVEELKAICTRIGTNSKLFLMGDNAQRDVRTDGLSWLSRLIDTHELPVDVHEFTSNDIVRSDLCATFVKAFESEENRNED